MNQEESIQFATKAVQDIVSFFEVNINVSAHLEDEVINIDVESSEVNSILIGHNAETLRSIQSLVSNMLRNHNAELTRISIDIAGYKRQHAEKIADKARGWIENVRKTGDSKVVNLNAADRRTVHKIAQEYSDIKTFSEGEGRERHLIIAQFSS